jgi:hypothetical protein
LLFSKLGRIFRGTEKNNALKHPGGSVVGREAVALSDNQGAAMRAWRLLVVLTILLTVWLIEASPRPQEDEYDDEYDRDDRKPKIKTPRCGKRGEFLAVVRSR